MGIAASDWISLDTCLSADRTEIWQELLTTSYVAVAVNERLPPNFAGQIRRRTLADLSIAECLCDPHRGLRSAAAIRRESEPCIGVQIVLAGSETFRLDATDVSLAPGSAVLWSSREAFDYAVHEPLHKVTLVIPTHAFGQRVRSQDLERGRLVPRDDSAGALLFPLVAALTRQFSSTGDASSCAVRRAIVELIVAAVNAGDERVRPRAPRERHLVRVQEYVLDHLGDAELRLCEIAASTGISLRYLHLLFERSGTSVSAYILNARLERCREALLDADAGARSITEIAFEWGFNNMAYFSRAFKRRFGVAPSNCRGAVRNRLA